MTEEASPLLALVGEQVVLDLAAPYVYLGTLAGIDGQYLVLEEADAHDLRDSSTTRELYVLDGKRHGIGVNRTRVYVERAQVVGISKLADVRE